MFGKNLDIRQSILLLMSLICFDFVPIGNFSEGLEMSCFSFSFRGAVLLPQFYRKPIQTTNVGISTGRDHILELIRKNTKEERSQ